MDKEFGLSEKDIIDRALQHVNSNVATDEEKLIVKLYKCDTMESILDKIHDDIQLSHESCKDIKQAFLDMENAWEKLFNTIYPYCGKCDEYACSVLFSFLEDTLINKFSSNKNNCVSRTFVLLGIIRDEMKEGQWYSMNEMYNIIIKKYPEYKGILLRENMNLILTACVQEKYFEEKREGNSSPRGKTRRRYFKKTNKEYLDLEEEKILDR